MHHRAPRRPRGVCAGPLEPAGVVTLWPGRGRRLLRNAAWAAHVAGYLAIAALGFAAGVLAAPFLIVRLMLRGVI